MHNMIKQLIPATRKFQRSGMHMTPQYITVHSTGNPSSTAKNEADYVCYNSIRQASFHFVVGEDIIYQVLPTDEIAWHAGDGRGKGNMASIAVEMVETGDRKAVVENTLSLVCSLMTEHSIPLDHVVQHHDWSGKNCPRILRDRRYIKDGVDWVWFVSKLACLQTKGGGDVEKVYNRLEDIPSYWREQVKWAKENEIFSGDGNGFGLTESQIKTLVFIYNDNRRRGTL